MKQFQSIQMLRGLAAVMVVLHHLTGSMASVYGMAWTHHPFRGGFAGVDLFFVISGFIITHTSSQYVDNRSALWPYLRKRIIRIYPIYWLVIVPLLALSYVLNVAQYDFSLANILQTLGLTPWHRAINPVTWTLSYELFFYTLFALLIFSKRLIVIPLLLLVLSLMNLATGWQGQGLETATHAYFYISPFNFEFLGGVCIALFFSRIHIKPLAILGLLIGSLAYFQYWRDFILDDVTAIRVWAFGIPSLGIVLALLKLEEKGILPTIPRFFIRLGDASYVLYLIHFPIIIFFNKRLISWHIHAHDAFWYNFWLFFALIGIAFLLHEFVEKPLTKRLGK